MQGAACEMVVWGRQGSLMKLSSYIPAICVGALRMHRPCCKDTNTIAASQQVRLW